MIYRRASSYFSNIPRDLNLVCRCSIFLHNWKKILNSVSMAHSSQGFYVVEDNETQLWNHMILWFRIIDGAVARPLAEVAWVWYKSDGSLLGILQESLFFWETEKKLISWNLVFVKLARNVFKKRYTPSILSYSLALFCDRKKQISFMQCWQWLWECSCFEQERRVKLFFMGTPAILFFFFSW